MEIVHRITDDFDELQQKTLADLGFDISVGLASIVICESDARWERLRKLTLGWGCFDLVSTSFSPEELEAARFLVMDPDWHHGYPQPEDDFEYIKSTYDLKDYAPRTGIGYKQNAPFRMRREPRWGRRHILQLNWVFDVFFVRHATWRAVFKPFGVESMPVLKHSSGKPLETVVQIKSQGIAPGPMDMEGHTYELCSKTGKRRYFRITRGFMPRLTTPCDMHYFESQEWFGSGGSANREVIVSDVLYREIVKNNLRGVCFKPLAS